MDELKTKVLADREIKIVIPKNTRDDEISNADKDSLDENVAKDNAWYVPDSFSGTDEEQALIKFIKEHIGNLEERYREVYLLRNEEVYKIFDFEKGRGFQPDFLLFLKTRKKHAVGVNDIELYYQIFIEPKGNEYIGADGTFTTGKEAWKEQFQDEIQKKYGFDNVINAESPDYRLIALPFFNRGHNAPFHESFREVVG